MFSDNQNGGISILGVLILGILLVLVLNYFHITIQVTVNNPTPEASHVGQTNQNLWTMYVQKPLEYIWNEIWLPYFWQPFLDALKNFKEGQPTSSQNSP
jgi:biopolymer transport protein ExbD